MKAHLQLAKQCFITVIICLAIGGFFLLVAPKLEFLYAIPLCIAFLSSFYCLMALLGYNWLGNRATTYSCPHCHKKIRFSSIEVNAPTPCEHCGKPISFGGLYDTETHSKTESFELSDNSEHPDRCPKCGFSHKYDGVKCLHCGYKKDEMNQQTSRTLKKE
jgi:DNA-directed RNA polymerase subunit RPC12/RpoP